jgi:fluoride ion exporter CrcB/FEX
VKKLFIIALGGIAGSLSRYLLTESITSYPIAILISNLIGVAIAGLFAFRFMPTDLSKLFWIPGFAGGMTTFSSVALIYAERIDLIAVGYFYGTVLASLAILYLIEPKVAK